MDVTDQILNNHRIYGSSDSTKQNYTSSSRCLNYANGGTIQHPEVDRVSNVPREINYRDSVGLFGSENYFVRVDVRLQNPIVGDYSVNDYKIAVASEEAVVPEDPYTYANTGGSTPGQAYIDYDRDTENDFSCGSEVICVNSYEPAKFSGDIVPSITSKYFKVELKNLKTGNKYVDSWLDVRLYNKFKDEHPYDVMYIKYNETFYIGFHARNTKRLPYNVTCEIGKSENSEFAGLLDLDEIDPRLLATKR